MLTERLASLLEPDYEVQRINLSPPDTDLVKTDARFQTGRLRHYLSIREHTRQALAAAPQATVFWPSISPSLLGHWRDRVTVLPAFRPDQTVYGVVHWGNFDRVFRHPLTRHSARRMVGQLAGLVFNPSLDTRCAPWIPAAKRITIPNTIDAAQLCVPADISAKQDDFKHRAAADHPIRLLYLSNMIPSKGYLDVLEAVRLLHARGVAVRADFAGGWMAEADRLDFEKRVHALNLTEHVTHHGAVTDRTQVKRLHLNADVFLLPTYYPTEAQPLTIVEALNAATPIITTRHASIPAMVRDGREALFVPKQDPSAIAAAVERLRTPSVWLAMSTQARERFVTAFSPEAVRAQWLRLVQR